MSTILVTGGSGFLGYHICKKLSPRFDKIIVADIAKMRKEEYPKNCEYVFLDISVKSNVEEVISKFKPDYIIHAAAALPLYSPKRIYEVNVRGTKNILEAAKKNKVKRTVFISSTAVYGVPKKHPIFEEDPRIGVGPYGKTKILAEKICESYRREGMCVPIIRPKTFIGKERLGVFQILYDWVESGKRIPIIGNGRNRYQLLEVEDLVDSIYLMIEKDSKKVNDTFNVGAVKFKTVYEDVSALCKYAKTGARVMRTPASTVRGMLMVLEAIKLSPLYKWVYGTAHTDSFVSVEKIQKKVGWKPKYSNAEALIRSYQWYLDNKEVLKNETGITHRVAWKQGALGIVKKFL